MLELNNKFTEIEENYTTAQKDLIKSQEQVVKLQRDLREVTYLFSRQKTCVWYNFVSIWYLSHFLVYDARTES